MKRLDKIPFGLKFKYLFSSKLILIGLMILSVPSIILMTFLPNADFHDSQYDTESISETKGVVLAVIETNSSVNGKVALIYEYEFYKEGGTSKGHSYGFEESIAVGDTLAVEYVIDDSSISRIVGTKNGAFGFDTLTFLFGFISIGLILIIISIYKTAKVLKMLSSGFKILPSKLQLELKTPSLPVGKSNPIYRLKFTYEISGSTYSKVIYTSQDENDIRRLRMSCVIVDWYDQTKSVVLEALPIKMRNYIVEKSTVDTDR